MSRVIDRRRRGTAGSRIRWLAEWMAAGCLALLAVHQPARAERSTAPPPDLAPVREKLAALQIPFVENRGQHDARVLFSADTFAGSVFVTRDGAIVHNFRAGNDAPSLAPSDEASPVTASQRGWTLVETLEGARALAPSGSQPATARISRFIGSDSEKWQRNLATFNRVEIGEAWDGIDVAVQAHGDNVEKLFTVKPGADAARIRVRMKGAESLRIGPDGSLIAATPDGEITFTAPVAFQERDGVRSNVEVAYALQGGGYGFTLGEHDAALPLVIDPLLQATYLGRRADDFISGMVVHPSTGEIYVVGSTNVHLLQDGSVSEFPGTSGGAQPTHGFHPDSGNNRDCFVTRLSADLSHLLQSTYLGGIEGDRCRGIAFHPLQNAIYVVGETNSTDFPGTSGGYQPSKVVLESYQLGSDFVVARLSADLTSLHQSSYLGGPSNDEGGESISIDPSTGAVFVAGITRRAQGTFPVTAGSAQPHPGDAAVQVINADVVVAKFSADLTALASATYLGGAGSEVAPQLSIHPAAGEVYVALTTTSKDFPASTGGAQAINDSADGKREIAVARLDSALANLLQSTYVGDVGDDLAASIAIHPGNGDVYVAGKSELLRGTSGGAQAVHGGGVFDGIVVRLAADLKTLKQATYLGGSSEDAIKDLQIQPLTGEVYVMGETDSVGFPGTAGAIQPCLFTYFSSDGSPLVVGSSFVTRINAGLTELQQSTYLLSFVSMAAMASHPISGEILLAGNTSSFTVPGTGIFTSGGAQEGDGGGTFDSDGYLVRISADLATPDLKPDPFAFAGQTGVPRGALVVSDSILVSGLEAPAGVFGGGAEDFSFSINGGPFTLGVRVKNGDQLRVRARSAGGYGAIRIVRVIIGDPFDLAVGGFCGRFAFADWSMQTLAFVDSDADGIGDDVDTDDDNDGLPDGQDPDPLNPDSDGDGIPDGQDVDVVQVVIAGLPLDAFRQPQQGNRNAILSILDQVEALIAAGDKAGAITRLQSLRKRVDGCGTTAQKDDWIKDCATQLQVRALIDLLITNLRA